MKALRMLAATVALLFTAVHAHAAKNLSDTERIELQAAMQSHIDGNLVDGAYLDLKEESGSVAVLYPSKAHPMILRMGNFFVLCTDFRNADGQNVNVDFYVARDAEKIVVFHASIDERAKLEVLMKAGKVEMLE
jgi:hypothetical protein